MAHPLTSSQRYMLSKVTADWQSIWDVGAANATNMTLSNLEKRGLVRLRADPSEPRFLKWQVQRIPEAHG